MPNQYTHLTFQERFWLKVDQEGTCWTWTGSKRPDGYGLVFVRRGVSTRLAHRVAWELATGEPVLPGYDVLHACDTPGCVRNDDAGWYEVGGLIRPRRGHLWLGTHTDNMADCAAKKRTASGDRNGARRFPERLPRGESQHCSRLTVGEATEIRRLYAAGGISQEALAKRFGVSQRSISDLVLWKTWKHAAWAQS